MFCCQVVCTSLTASGSRAGAIIAACWATMMYFGEEGYVSSTKKIIETTKYIEKKYDFERNIFESAVVVTLK